ncbi:hypothetical protein DDZ14_16045 [Maritimibacter sp. 55A14]|uniref:hypothetical protein n=1 Tax=Maritimibacter sp. 55A14 TaxID=2174844 RepID=UPI000D6072FE|nr:hypothetical protein [Maritimibacter sp. 55A14]PWE29952.1 hypothetical protein DDZ14_16045 [Maritimibacter sp. 55A14]
MVLSLVGSIESLNSTGHTSHSFPFTLSAGADRLVVLLVAARSQSSDGGGLASATIGGQPLSQITQWTHGARRPWVAIWAIREADLVGSGSQTVQVDTNSLASDAFYVVTEWSGADVSAAASFFEDANFSSDASTGTFTSAAPALTVGNDGGAMLGVCSTEHGGDTMSVTGATEIAADSAGNLTGSVAYEVIDPLGPAGWTWNWGTADQFAFTSLALVPAATAGDSVTALGLVAGGRTGLAAAGQTHQVAAPGLSAPSRVGQAVLQATDQVAAPGLSTAARTGLGAIGQAHSLSASGLRSLTRVDAAQLQATDQVAAAGLRAGAGAGNAPLAQLHRVSAPGIVAPGGVGTALLSQTHSVSAVALSAGARVGPAAIGQVHAIVALGLGAAARLADGSIMQVHEIAADGLAVPALVGTADAIGDSPTDEFLIEAEWTAEYRLQADWASEFQLDAQWSAEHLIAAEWRSA